MKKHLTDLIKGQKVTVIKNFLDFDNQVVEKGTTLTFSNYSYFPYDGGYTFDFEEGGFRLAEIDGGNRTVLDNFNEFFEITIEDTWTQPLA